MVKKLEPLSVIGICILLDQVGCLCGWFWIGVALALPTKKSSKSKLKLHEHFFRI